MSKNDPLMGGNRDIDKSVNRDHRAGSTGIRSILLLVGFGLSVLTAFLVGKEYSKPNDSLITETSKVATSRRDQIVPVEEDTKNPLLDTMKAAEQKGPWGKNQAEADDGSKTETAPRFRIESLAESEMSMIDPGYGCSLRSRERYYLLMNSEQSVMKVGGVVLQRELADKLFQEITAGNAEFRSGDYIIRIAKTGSERRLYEGHEFPVSMRVSMGTKTSQVSGIFGCSA